MAVPAPVLPWYSRALAILARALRIQQQPQTVEHGPEWGADHTAPNPYPAVNSMSAFARFPWANAAVHAIAEDISGLPLKVVRGEGASAREVPDHPALLLLRRPNSWQGRASWERQWLIDWLLSGDAYAVMAGGRTPSSLIRLHPIEVEILPAPSGGPRAYQHSSGGSPILYDVADVLHLRSPSWQSGPEGLYGQGAIQALSTELSGEWAAAQQWARSAATGRPDAIISPKDGSSEAWGKKAVRDRIGEQYRQQISKGGALVLGGEASVTLLPFSARDMEFSAARAWSRASTLAVLGAASTRVFLPDANFATAQQQMRTYWQSLLGKIAILDEQLSRLAERVGRPGDRIVHDTSGVEALQESRSDRLTRVATMVGQLGIPAADALSAEGFGDLAQVAGKQAGKQAGMSTAVEPQPPVVAPAGTVLPFPGGGQMRKDASDLRRQVPLLTRLFDPARQKAEGDLAPEYHDFIGSTQQADHAEDVIIQAGIKLEVFNANPVILWMHDRRSLPIGTGEATFNGSGALQIRVFYDQGDPEAMVIAGKVERRVIRAGSVGIIVHEWRWRSELPPDDPYYDKDSWGWVIYSCTLVEYSLVTVPMNQGALRIENGMDDDALQTLAANPHNRERLRALLKAAPTASTTDTGAEDPWAAFFKQ
jgi:HK97 family phage portal protein